MESPAATLSAVSVLVGIAFEPLEDVVRLDPQLRGAPGRWNGARTAAAKQDGFLAGRHCGFQALVKPGIHDHPRPLLPDERDGARNESDPRTLCVATYVDQHGIALLPPVVSQLRAHIARISLG